MASGCCQLLERGFGGSRRRPAGSQGLYPRARADRGNGTEFNALAAPVSATAAPGD